MKEMTDKYSGYGVELNHEDINEIGFKLIRNYADIELTAGQLDMSPARLRYLLTHNNELAIYHEIAQEGIKGLTDSLLIQALRGGDKDILRFVAARLYAGRSRGGFNISEMGTVGYNDPLSKKLAAETENAQKTGNVVVNFNFIKKEIPQHFAIESSTDAIDAEFEDIEDDDKQ